MTRLRRVTVNLPEPARDTIIQHFRPLNVDVYGVWTIPHMTDHHVVFAEGPGDIKASYGPQVFVVRQRDGSVDVLHATKQLMDMDFMEPAFFGSADRLLMLANFGSEDSWGLIALQLAPGAIEDYGTIDVVRPGDIDFTESAVPAADVFFRDGRYVIAFRGEVIESPGEGPTKYLAKRGQRAVFALVQGRFEYVRTE